MKKVKVIAVLVILLLVLIVFLQNTEAVETRLLFMTISMPRVLLLAVTFILGFVGGLITANHILSKPGKAQKQS